MSTAGLLSIEWEITDQHLPMPHIIATACAAFVEEPCPPHTLRRCPACGVHIYDLTDAEGADQ